MWWRVKPRYFPYSFDQSRHEYLAREGSWLGEATHADHFLDLKRCGGVHAKFLETHSQQQARIARIPSHLATHRLRYAGGFVSLDETLLISRSSDGWRGSYK